MTESMTVHYTRCWPCQFAERRRDHPNQPHTWMSAEDIEHKQMATPETPEDWATLAERHPCNCWCNGQKPVEVVVPTTDTLNLEAQP